ARAPQPSASACPSNFTQNRLPVLAARFAPAATLRREARSSVRTVLCLGAAHGVVARMAGLHCIAFHGVALHSVALHMVALHGFALPVSRLYAFGLCCFR